MGCCYAEEDKIDFLDRTKPKPADLVGEHWGSVRQSYDLKQTLGEGKFGRVYSMVNKSSGAARAVKQISKSNLTEKGVKALKSQFHILKGIDHPNVVKVFEMYEDQKSIYIVTQLLSGGQLFDQIIAKQRLEEKLACQIARTLLQTISYCHGKGIVHRDLKPQNILFAKGGEPTIKVVDFGCSVQTKANLQELIGTPYYVAPEVIGKKYDSKCDIWSIGVIVYIMLTGSPPFGGRNSKDIMEAILAGKYNSNLLVQLQISESGRSLVKKLLTLDPAHRPTASEALQHDWFRLELSIQPGHKVGQALANMRQFFAQKKLKMAIEYYIYNQYQNEQDTAGLTRIFRQLDLNGDGMLNRHQIETAVKQHDLTEDNLKLFEKLLQDQTSDSINYSEFMVAASDRRNMLSRDRIDRVFRELDKDGSGQVQVAEVRRILSGYDQQQVQRMFNELGIRDGKISLEMWRKIMEQNIVAR